MTVSKKQLSAEQIQELIKTLKARFEKNMHRHKEIEWSEIFSRFEANPGVLRSLHEMEATGGEPDLTGFDKKTDQYIFRDCSKETPKGRRSVCYDLLALESRKLHKPEHSAMGMALEMGIELLTEEQYYELQQLENFDTKTSSWLQTPKSIRDRGGAIFGDWRYGRVFIYHNGAESYYPSRGFRGLLRV
jgi:hypothetical protein